METIFTPSFSDQLTAVTFVVALWAYGLAASRVRFPTTVLAATVTGTDELPLWAWPSLTAAAPTKRPRSRRKKEVTTVTNNHDGDTTVFEVIPDPPVGVPVPIGDVTQTGEQPLFEQDPRDALNVVVNVSFARTEGGTRAVRVLDGTGKVLLQLSAAQAHQLTVDLAEAADYVGVSRQKAGFTS